MIKRKWNFCNCCCFKKKRSMITENGEILLSEHHQVINNKAADLTVFSQEISKPLKPGSCILIRGSIRPHCKRFAVNLLYVRGAKTDVVFHFNPRLALRYIVRNSCLNNSWGQEETTSVEKFHLYRNKLFQLQILAADNEFLVALDGRHICEFVYRTALEKINKIEVQGIEVEGIEVIQQIKIYPQVTGAVDIENVEVIKSETFPIEEDNESINSTRIVVLMQHKDNLLEKEEQLSENDLIVPITAHLPNGFKCGWQLEIIGRVKILPSAFYINLQQGDKIWPHPIIPLHLNPRFYTTYGNHLFVRNSWMNGEWGNEERTPGFQFTPGQWFYLAIRMNSDSFGVWVDGTLCGEFKFRTPIDAIDTVYVHGDVKIKDIRLKDYIDDKYFSQHNKDKLDKYL